MYPIIAVPEDAPNLPEQLGSKEKFWFENEQKVRCLFKLGRPDTGDDWSEKVACEICGLVGLPHAQYELATHKGQGGVLTATFVPEGGRLVHGNELLAKVVDEYPVKKIRGVKEHTLTRVMAAIRSEEVNVPIGFASFEGVDSAMDVFVGYLMLDALIANQDRHHENWGLVVDSEMKVHLAPSFDHASCLGANESDKNREDRLNTKDVGRSMEYYVTRAKSAFYASVSGRRPMLTAEAFLRAARLRPKAGRAWLSRVKRFSQKEFLAIFERIPEDRISPIAVSFASRMLELNCEHLLKLERDLQ